MKINVKGLRQALGNREHFDLQENFPPLKFQDETIEFNKPVKVSLDITNAGDFLDARGKITTAVRLNCGRCLESFVYPLETNFEEHYYPVEEGQELEGPDDEDAVSFTGETLNIEPEVINTIQLAIPMRQICSEECRGLCPQCGTNLNKEECSCKNDNIDPRMAVLKELLEEK